MMQKPVDFKEWRKTIFEGQLKCGDIGFEANIIENHDEPRGVNTYLPPHAQNDAGKKNVSDGGDNASGTAVFVPGAGNRHGELPNGIGRGI